MSQTVQQRMRAKLEQAGIPFREIKVYGSQIMITALSEGAAQRWTSLLSKFAKVRGAKESLDETEKSTPNQKRYVRVWKIWATV